MDLLSQPVGVSHFMAVGAVMFVCGAVCMATKRNGLGVLMGIELVLNGANVNFVAFGSDFLRNNPDVQYSVGIDGQLIALFVIVLAAAEAAVALAIALNYYNNFATIDVDRAEELKG
jgi:NADH:ubiquinone oxidoreductase subunit K